jgi:hypothetical protein
LSYLNLPAAFITRKAGLAILSLEETRRCRRVWTVA